MSKPTGITKSVETWTVRNPKTDPKVTGTHVQVLKIAVRHPDGRFHGATNFKTKA